MRRRKRGWTGEDGHRLVANRLHAAKIGEKPHIAKKNSNSFALTEATRGSGVLLHCKKAALRWHRLGKTRSYATQHKNRLLGRGVISDSVDHALRFDLPLMRKFVRKQEGLSEDS